MGTTANVLVGDAEITLGVGILARVIGFTVDGVSMSVRSTMANIKVEEQNGTLIRRLTDQEVDVTLNVAEGTLANLTAAIPGAVATTGAITTIGGGTLQAHRLTLRGLNPAGKERVIILNNVNPTGEVTTPYKKGDVSVVPMTFSALVSDAGVFGTKYDAGAVPPTLVVGASTKSAANGLTIDALFSTPMAAVIGVGGITTASEFWFTEADFVPTTRYFSGASVAGSTITLTVTGVAITVGKALRLFYALGSVTSTATGVLASFADQVVVPR